MSEEGQSGSAWVIKNRNDSVDGSRVEVQQNTFTGSEALIETGITDMQEQNLSDAVQINNAKEGSGPPRLEKKQNVAQQGEGEMLDQLGNNQQHCQRVSQETQTTAQVFYFIFGISCQLCIL